MYTPLSRRSWLRQATTIGTAAALGNVLASPLARLARAAEKPRIKIGQIGVGHAHPTKLSVYRKSADYEVVGIVEPDRELRERAATNAAYRDLPWMTEEQLLNTPGLQAVLVETRVRDLLPTAARAIAAGKHVHLDKPAGESLRQYRDLLAAAPARRPPRPASDYDRRSTLRQLPPLGRLHSAVHFPWRASPECFGTP